MFEVTDNNAIMLTRGDTARLSVDLTTVKGDVYEMGKDDTLTLKVKKRLSDSEPVIYKEVIGANDFHIEPKDTKHLPFGMYIYSVRLITTEGDEYTVIDNSSFKIGEVT
jgi:hypothetical protein